RCKVAHRGNEFATTGIDTFALRADEPDDWTRLLTACADTPVERVIYLWNLDATETVAQDAAMGTDALLHLAHAMDAIFPAAKMRFDMVTRGAQPVGRGSHPTAVAQAPSIGLMRVVQNEYSNLTCRGVDLPPEKGAADLD